MKPAFLITFSVAMVWSACDRPDCEPSHPIFSQHEPSSPEYKKELISQLKSMEAEDVSYWFDSYVEKDGNEYLQFNIQGEDICALGLMKVEDWTEEIANIKRVKGKSYRGAKFRGLTYTIEEQADGIELIYKDLESIID
ncbi:hypothetical protein [Catalinimonas niigatensis]|uniref:hypothetical protein n=1 Tax=Catalinimonas niigatensis TaxID=1397264 RepID=UPI0026654D86|nr:hypothetical protein [Catalinimonas niigatensis]WPP49849.1 hypothetical protein PZB72_24560 [Catalinimonas niigatensis]